MTRGEKGEKGEMVEFTRPERGEKGEHPTGSSLSPLTRPSDSRGEKVVSNTPTTRDALSADPALLRLATALRTRFAARLTYLATPSYTAGKPPQPATADAFTEYR